MNKSNIFLLVFLLTVIYSCSTIKPQYRKGEPTKNFNFPTGKEKEKSFLLIGDAGYSPEHGSAEAIKALKHYVDSVSVDTDYAIFLGDNIYPVGMPEKNDPQRAQAEYRLNTQLDAMKSFGGKVIFIPGNHDWYNNRLPGLKREAEYLKNNMKKKLIWAPKAGCALQTLDVSENIEVIFIDSQWYLENWDKSPRINEGCPNIKTREAFIQQVAGHIRENQDKTFIIAMHHPMYTNGVHGGQYNLTRHIYPSAKKIPVPILGSLAALIRTSGGVSIQDAQNKRYKSLVDQLKEAVKDQDRLIFVSGHEHTLQYIEHEGIKQIVSGAGSKSVYVTLSNDGLFAYPQEGFAVLDIFKDGSGWVSYYKAEKGKPKLLYQKEVFSKREDYDISQLHENFPKTITTSIYSEEDTDKGAAYKTLWGERYRDLYSTPVNFKVAQLDSLKGGLKPLLNSGGPEVAYFLAKDSKDRDYKITKLKRKQIHYLKNSAYREKPLRSDLNSDVSENLVNDFYTSAHPYAFLAIPDLSQYLGIYHTNPQIFYLPKQKSMKGLNKNEGNAVYMMEERPEPNWRGYKDFGAPEAILSTSEVFDRLREDDKYAVDEKAFIRARLFDMLIGDWDRGQAQWKWAEVKNKNGLKVFKPIPINRQEAFSNFDGAFFGTLKALTGLANQFAVYGEDIKDVEWFNIAALGLDRSLLQNTGKEAWIEQAKFIQHNLTNSQIEEAFAELPPETRGEATQELIKKLEGRRDNLLDIALRYYKVFSKLAIITGTDKEDIIDIERLPKKQIRVGVYTNKNNKRAEKKSEKLYLQKDTKNIWIYGLEDSDIFNVKGNAKDGPYVRIIGGRGIDKYTIQNEKRLKIYDYEYQPSKVVEGEDAAFRFSNRYDINTYDKDKKNFNSKLLSPRIGFNPDDGLTLGILGVFSKYDFKRNPFTSQHSLLAKYYFSTSSYSLNYKGEFANIIGNYNLKVGAHFTSPDYTYNFFGYGNKTPNFDKEKGYNYNRVKLSKIGVEAGFINPTPFGSFFGYSANFEGVEVQKSTNRFVDEEFNTGNNFYKRNYFAGLDAIYRYESYDNEVDPTRGMKFELNLGGKINTASPENNFGYFKPYLGFYNALTRNRKWVLKTTAQAHLNIGSNYEFYQAAHLGANTGLRGYRFERFAGKSAFATSADLRYGFNEFSTSFLPIKMGVYGGFDVGRVWADGESLTNWHNSYGGGIWINSTKALNGNISLFKSDDGFRFSFGFGFHF